MSRDVYRYWISWYEPNEDYRPVVVPETSVVVGYWCSGYDAENRASMCALVWAYTPSGARLIIRKFWGHNKRQPEWRFCEQKPMDWLPGDRFPLKKPAAEEACKENTNG